MLNNDTPPQWGRHAEISSPTIPCGIYVSVWAYKSHHDISPLISHHYKKLIFLLGYFVQLTSPHPDKVANFRST